MDRTAFEADLAARGFENAGVKEMVPHCHEDLHSHDFEVRAMVLEGSIDLTFNGAKRHYAPGDIVEMAHGCEHIEDVGPDGLKFLVGRKHS